MKEDILRKWEEVSHLEIENRCRLPKIQKDRKAKTLIKSANNSMFEIKESLIDDMDINIFNQLMYSAAAVITEMEDIKLKEKNKGNRKQPAWKKKIEKEIAQKRSDLSILIEIANGVNVNERKKRNISRRYKIKKPEEIAVIREQLKQQNQAKAQRIRFFK